MTIRVKTYKLGQKTAVFLSLFLVLLSASACSGRQNQPTNDTAVTVTAEPAATAVGETTLVVTLTDASGQPVSDATVQVRGDMTHAGMTPVLRTGLPTEPGVYSVPFEWTMAGDWIVTVDFTLADGRSGTETFNFSIPTS
ncbi:MAG: FixH family protein [Anaerolineales bacterium]|nr:FixH family protein [Anaerolineales bacterium]